MDTSRKLELFDAARRKLGIKRLFMGGKEMLLNGENAVDSPREDLMLEVRDDDGITILARKSCEQVLHKDGFNYNEHWATRPSIFDVDNEDDPAELQDEWPYRSFSDHGECDGFETTDMEEDAFYKALGVPLVFEDDGQYRGTCSLTFVHVDLVQQWRDLCNLDVALKRSTELTERVEQRAGVTKRARLADV